MNLNDYTITEHRHRYAAWAASRAAGVSPLCRFTISVGQSVIDKSGLKSIASSIDNLPRPNDFDDFHKFLRKSVIDSAVEEGISRDKFTHGVAAKLINVYFKSIFVCGDKYDDPRVKVIHPPIDSVLLDDLYKNDVGGLRNDWKKAKEFKWSKFDSDQYESVISAIKTIDFGNDGLWKVEFYWKGFQ